MGWFLAKGDPVEGTFKFVPVWGWVGSYSRCSAYGKKNIFVPEWGWVGSSVKLKIATKHTIFVPEWGWVGS